MSNPGTATIGVHTTFLDGQDIYLIDTPGFDDTTRTDTSVLIEIAAWLKKSYDDKVQLAGIVYLHRISDNRVGGSGTHNIRLFKELCGEQALSCVVLTTSMWDLVPPEKAKQREKELISKEEFWGGLVRHGCRVARQDDGSVSATMIIRHILSQKRPDSFQIQDEMADGTPLIRTKAGRVLEEKLDEQTRVSEERMKRLQDEIERLKAEKAESEKRTQEEKERLEREASEREKKEQEEKERWEKETAEANRRAAEAENRAQEERESRRRQAQEEKERQERETSERKKKEQKEKERWEKETAEANRRAVEAEKRAQEERKRRQQAQEERDRATEDRLRKLEEQFESAKKEKERNEEEKENLKRQSFWDWCSVM